MSQPLRVAGFELIISGRFWVIAKVMARDRYFTDDRVKAFVFPVYGTTEDAQEASAIG
jgi:hypothetical protein